MVLNLTPFLNVSNTLKLDCYVVLIQKYLLKFTCNFKQQLLLCIIISSILKLNDRCIKAKVLSLQKYFFYSTPYFAEYFKRHLNSTYLCTYICKTLSLCGIYCISKFKPRNTFQVNKKVNIDNQ